ncbi:MAG: threonine/serine dehydratase [Crocinitomicaceae bacterium]|nr:threonine/serine dehydratase [Crocinitomicaceae bacterium]
MAKCQIFFKCENFQRMGAFKMRGAVNAILQLPESKKTKGVVTHSSGNFAQALALAAKSVGVKSFIVMPESAPQVKKDAVQGYGGEIILCESTNEARQATADKIAAETGATFIHPSNDLDVILGQGTAALELLQMHPDLAFILAPVGGGGLIAGTAIAAKTVHPNCIVIGGEPFEVDDAYQSLKAGKIVYNQTSNTIADGLKTHLGDINFPIIQEGVQAIIRVTEQEIIAAMRIIWERMKIIVEPSCAVPLAAVLKEPQHFENKKIGIILSGGNVDLTKLPF